MNVDSTRSPGGIGRRGGLGPLGPGDGDRGIPALFEDVVRSLPDGIAVQTEDLALCYSALNGRANQVAHALAARGVALGDVVAIAADSTSSQAIGLLGVLKAGAVAVFLDRKSPPSRVREILLDCSARVVLSEDATTDLWGGQTETRPELEVRPLGLSDVSGFSERNPEVSIPPGSLMAIYFTSGTTGRPKGICRSHRQGIYEAYLDIRALDLGPEDRLLMPVSFSFGASTRYVLGGWLAGAALCPVSPDAVGIGGLLRIAREVRATLYYSTPSLFRHVLRAAGDEPPLESLRAVSLTGEAVRSTDLEGFRRLMGSRRGLLLTALGSTECGAYCHLVVTPEMTFSEDILPAGLPVEGKEVLILDEQRNPMPPGQTGEIAVRSAYLTPGYWKRPDLNEELFDLAPGHPGERVFRTGDLGRRDEQGLIRVVGRRDLQVKIRGYRVEPGEIEAVLCRCAGIRGAAVLPMEGPGGPMLLVGYLVLDPAAAAPDREAIDRHLLAHLPPYMVPARYQVMDEFPLTDRNKIDRRAIPLATSRLLGRTGETTPESDPLVVELRRIWAGVLRREPSGFQEGFFEMGGDSLMAMQLLAHIQARWNLTIPVSAFLQSPTLESVARWITSRTRFGPERFLFPLNGAMAGLPELYFLPGLGRNSLEVRELALALEGQYACWGMEFPPAGDGTETIEELGAHCAELIASRNPVRPIFLGGFSLGGLIAFEAGRHVRARGIPLARVFILDSTLFALRPPKGWPRIRCFLRNGWTHPHRALQFMGVYLMENWIRPLWNRWRGGPGASGEPDLGRMPHRAAARAYVPRRASLPLTFVLGWERRLEVADPAEPWQSFNDLPVRSIQMSICSHADFVKPPNLPDLARVLRLERDRAGESGSSPSGPVRTPPTESPS